LFCLIQSHLFFCFMTPLPPSSTLFPYTTLFRSMGSHGGATAEGQLEMLEGYNITEESMGVPILSSMEVTQYDTLNGIPLYCDKRSEEHTSELQSRFDLVCRLLLEKKKRTQRERRRAEQSETERDRRAKRKER